MNNSVNLRPLFRAQPESTAALSRSPVKQEARALIEAASSMPLQGRRMRRLERLTGRVRAGAYRPTAQALAEEIVADWEFDARLMQTTLSP